MPISKDIAPSLPYLRRFSRALNGSQESGDAYLTATLEYLLANPKAFSRDLPPRLALCRLYLEVWSATNVGDPILADDASAYDRHLAELSPRTRQAFLLRPLKASPSPRSAPSWGSTPRGC